ncbi:MAG: hypothetical protein IPK16_26050 [Anaerolineales bacterium]|nr:hypothetical protein [Anaerolineales bacterium]
MQTSIKSSTAVWGFLLIALGSFLLLQATGILGVLSGLFWTIVFAAVGAAFLYVFLTAVHTRWWAAIPGFTLLGLAATVFYDHFAPPFFSDIGGAVFLASIGASFIAIFFTNRHLWWALIPGGALLSVAGVVLVSQAGLTFINPASVLFVGLGATFGLVGLLSTYLNINLRWAYIPAAVLLVLGMFIFTPFMGVVGMVLPLALIGGGAYLVLRRHHSAQQLSLPPEWWQELPRDTGAVQKTVDTTATTPSTEPR